MPIIAGNQICIPTATGAAGRIISAMEELLKSRHQCRMTRRQFIGRWGRMRKALFLTEEYQSFRKAVLARCGGVCESCHKHPAQHVHHIRPVAFSPRLALITANAKGTCVGCHKALDAASRMQALSHQNPTEHPSGAPSRPALPSTLNHSGARSAHHREAHNR